MMSTTIHCFTFKQVLSRADMARSDAKTRGCSTLLAQVRLLRLMLSLLC